MQISAYDLAFDVPAEIVTAAEAAGFTKQLEYLLSYGWSQSLQDSVAAAKAKAKKDGKSDEEVESLVASTMSTRAEAILAATIGIRGPGAPRLSELDREIRKIGEEAMRAMAKASNVKLPDRKTDEGKATYDALFAKFLEVYSSEWTAEAERRIEARKAAVGNASGGLEAIFAQMKAALPAEPTPAVDH